MDYSSVMDVARQLGIYPGRIYRAHAFGRVPEPYKVGKARLYTAADVERLRDYFSNQKKSNKEKV